MVVETEIYKKLHDLSERIRHLLTNSVTVSIEPENLLCSIECNVDALPVVCKQLVSRIGLSFATMIVEESNEEWLIQYVFYSSRIHILVNVMVRQEIDNPSFPSMSSIVHALDWQEREAEDLFGIVFEGHPVLGDFVLHEEWPEGVNPMRRTFRPEMPYPHKETRPEWQPRRILQEPGAFMMPIGPIFSGISESAHFLLETVGEDVVRSIPRFFYKYRGVEKIAEGKHPMEVVLLAERFAGTSAFAHSLAFCHAVESIAGVEVPERAVQIRILFAEFERFRHHISCIEAICNSTGLAVAASQAAILEEEALRLSCEFAGHRYLFGLNIPGGLSKDLSKEDCTGLLKRTDNILKRLDRLYKMLQYSSSFLDRLEEVGIICTEDAIDYGLVGPVARASGVCNDIRKALPYKGYENVEFSVPCETEGDGYARLRVFFQEAFQSVMIMSQTIERLSDEPIYIPIKDYPEGSAIGWVEAPAGAAFHYVRIDSRGRVIRYRLTTPSFTNWHGFHLAAEGFAFQDFPIILATFGLSIAESDR
ncbi:MAG: hypothetical protein GXO97_04275 [Nitrospirae bacterium]|nr:hypothetical protein [Nitrospirota bacterium]